MNNLSQKFKNAKCNQIILGTFQEAKFEMAGDINEVV